METKIEGTNLEKTQKTETKNKFQNQEQIWAIKNIASIRGTKCKKMVNNACIQDLGKGKIVE